MFSHEASIIATKERAEMKMIEFFIPRKLSLTALGVQSQSAVSRKADRNFRQRAGVLRVIQRSIRISAILSACRGRPFVSCEALYRASILSTVLSTRGKISAYLGIK